jgi:hypothetical protein
VFHQSANHPTKDAAKREWPSAIYVQQSQAGGRTPRQADSATSFDATSITNTASVDHSMPTTALPFHCI